MENFIFCAVLDVCRGPGNASEAICNNQGV